MTVALIGGGGIAEGIANVVPDCRIVPKSECDVTDIGDVDSIIRRTAPVAIVLTAGISTPSEIGDLWSGNYQSEIAVNLMGAFNVARCYVNNLVGGPLIFIASVAGMHGKPGHAGYCASKAGVISLMQSMAFEGNDAYAISPGRVDTPMRERDYPNDTPGSRLAPTQIGEVVNDILAGGYEPGDNICIRKVGLTETILSVDKGAPWRERLAIGLPVTI